MALTKARKAVKRSTSATAAAGAGAGRSMSMAPPPGPPPLPPGVYFHPTHAESIAFLNRWIAGDDKMPDARGFIFHADMYADDPYALQQLHTPASDRAGKQTWWFLGESKFQSLLSTTKTKRADRTVRTGGFWRVEQTKKRLNLEGGVRNCFGFYSKKRKTEWLMQEFTSDMDRGDGRKGMPALHKLYVTPRKRPTDDDQTDVYDYEEDGVTERKKKPVPADYFAAAAALLPPGSARGLRQEHVEPPQASQLPPSPPPLPHYNDDGQSFMNDIMSYVGLLHHDSKKGQNSTGAPMPMPANVLGQYQQQNDDEDAPDDSLSIPMDQFMRILDKPMDTTVEGEEPAWDSLPDIVDHDEFVKFNKDV